MELHPSIDRLDARRKVKGLLRRVVTLILQVLDLIGQYCIVDGVSIHISHNASDHIGSRSVQRIPFTYPCIQMTDDCQS
jgi:hypothetical protein